MSKRGVNKVILLGRIGQDPELKHTPSGDAVANFTIATSEVWTDKNSGQKQERTEWHRCVAWRKIAEIIGQYVTKGDSLYIEGHLSTRKWTDAQGVERYQTEIVVDEMQLIGGKKEGGQPAQQKQSEPQKPSPQSSQFDDSDDIMF